MKRNDYILLKRTAFSMLTSVLSLTLALLVGGVLVAGIGINPISVFSSLFRGGLGSPLAIAGTLNRMAPILLAGIALTMSNSCGIFNIGFEGQFLIGSIAAAAAGYLFHLPPVLHVIAVFLAGMTGAMVWSLMPVTLYLRKDISIVFSSIMLNFIAKYVVEYLIPMFPEYQAVMDATPRIQNSAILPDLMTAPVKINASVLISVFAVILVYIILFRTKMGYEMRAVGLNKSAAYSAGINTKKRLFGAILLSAVFAGMSCSLELMGSTYRLIHNYAPGYMGFGIAVAMLGKQNPFAILIAAFLFSAMRNGSPLMQMNTGVSAQFIMALQGLIIIFICSENMIRYLLNSMKTKQKYRKEAKHA